MKHISAILVAAALSPVVKGLCTGTGERFYTESYGCSGKSV